MSTKLILQDNFKDTFTATFLVEGGEMDGKIVQVCYGLPILLRQNKERWDHITNFETDVIDSIGILHYKGNPVTYDVLEAYNHSDIPFGLELNTGKWTPGIGWEITIPFDPPILTEALR